MSLLHPTHWSYVGYDDSHYASRPYLLTCTYLSNARLKPLDIETMKRLGSRVNLIPVVAKADTLTPQDLLKFKQRVSLVHE